MSLNTTLNKNLSKHTSFFGIKLWVLLVAFIAFFVVVIVIVIFLCIISLCRRKSKFFKPHFGLSKPICCNGNRSTYHSSSLDRRLLSRRISEIEMNIAKLDHLQVLSPDQWSNQANQFTTRGSVSVADSEEVARRMPALSDTWRGNKFSLTEIEVVTNGFADENVIGNGDHGIVYRGILLDATRVAVKRLLHTSCQAEDFLADVEVVGHVRHKNLVRMLGYCMEGGYRMLVSEYVDNGNLHQWLHGCPEQVSPLTWCIRMNIIQGIAKGLVYLHEDIEPKIVHQDLKSNNILLDHQWRPKISDFGIAKLLGPEWNKVTAQSMETSGYLSQENDSTGVLNEKSDVYSFGILVMEIICGRTPVDHQQPQVYLIDWLKSMVANQKIMYVADPKLPEIPSSKELKRILLLALRCVDPDIKYRPTMGDVIHMLEPRDLLLHEEHWIRKDASSCQNYPQESQIIDKSSGGNFNTHERECSSNLYQKMMPK